MKLRKAVVLGGATVLSLAATALIQVTAGPSEPSWVGSDSRGNYGVVDVQAMPDRIGVLDSNGNRVGYVTTDDLYGAPSDDPSTPESQARVRERARNGQPPTIAAQVPVYDERGRRVGYVGDRGFVRDGGTP